MTNCAIALIASKDGQMMPSGSASLISPTLAVTAEHVIRDYEKQLGMAYNLQGAIAQEASHRLFNSVGQVLGDLATSDNVIARQSARTAVIENSDLALIEFNAPFPTEVIPAPIRLRPPIVGEEVVGFGFIQSEAEPINEDGTKVFWRHAAWTDEGNVSDLYLKGRDRNLPYPSFAALGVDWRHGTSGGPILDRQGRLLAIVSSGIPANEEAPPVSFGSLLWPVIGAANLGAYPYYLTAKTTRGVT